MKILVLNGPNLNLLGVREPEVYGRATYADLERVVAEAAARAGAEAECRQTNHEGTYVDWIQEARGTFDALVLNPAAYTHTSVAILDALKAVALPAVEVHISDVAAREDFRQVSYVRAACAKTIAGKGLYGYAEAIAWLAARHGQAGAGTGTSAGAGAPREGGAPC